MAKIVDARLARAPIPGPVQTLLDPAERLLHGGARESGPKLGAEEVLGPRCSKTRVATVGVAGQCLGRSWMERDESGFAEFGLADGEDAVDEVDIVGREAAGLGEPQAGRGQQREVGDIGGGSQPAPGQAGSLPAAGARPSPPRCRCGALSGAGYVPGARPVELRWPGRRARGTGRTAARPPVGVRPAPGCWNVRIVPTGLRARSSWARWVRSGLHGRRSPAVTLRPF